MAMASNIHIPNLKIKESVLTNTKLNTNIIPIALKLMTEIPNINKINADSKSAVNSSMIFP